MVTLPIGANQVLCHKHLKALGKAKGDTLFVSSPENYVHADSVAWKQHTKMIKVEVTNGNGKHGSLVGLTLMRDIVRGFFYVKAIKKGSPAETASPTGEEDDATRSPTSEPHTSRRAATSRQR